LISTLPLKDFLALQPLTPLKRYRSQLAHNDTLFVSVVLKSGRQFKRFADCHWLFFARPEIFYRINMMHIFCRTPFHYLVAEITWRKEIARMPPHELERRVVEDLIQAGILSKRSDVEKVSGKLVPFTYPIPTLGLSKALRELDTAFAKERISLLGRNGRWEYLNMDQVIEQVWDFFARFPKRRLARAD
jgi:protoporphyrinogen oxidase